MESDVVADFGAHFRCGDMTAQDWPQYRDQERGEKGIFKHKLGRDSFATPKCGGNLDVLDSSLTPPSTRP